MRKLFLALALVATPALGASEMVMHRDPGCGCCMKWAAQVKAALGRSVKVVDNVNRAALQKRLGITSSLQSCHTAFIDGMAFEGHVLCRYQAGSSGKAQGRERSRCRRNAAGIARDGSSWAKTTSLYRLFFRIGRSKDLRPTLIGFAPQFWLGGSLCPPKPMRMAEST